MSKQAASYRALLYLCSIAGLLCFFVAYKGSKGALSKEMGVTLALLGLICFLTGAWYGWRGAKIRIEEREKKADALGLVMLAGVLKDKSEEELQLAMKKGGPAGEAARLVLERRKTGLTRPSQQIPTQTEIN
ncbi:MAG TPA: hypothetical protein VF454_02240 [Gemmatimonadales bacterium]